MEVVAEASDLDGASRALRAHRPQVLVLDLWISEGAGRTMIGDLLASAPRTQIVVASVNDSPAFARALLEVGAVGFVLKELADPDLPRAIRAAADGAEYVSPRLAERLRTLRPTRSHLACGTRDA